MEQSNLQSCTSVYGDLGMTASLLIWPHLFRSASPEHPVCIVPHATDATLKREAKEAGNKVKVFSISPDVPETLTKELLNCEYVISSSLHVLMIAETFGVPVRWYNGPDSNKPEKYVDYFHGIGVFYPPESVDSLQDALRRGPSEPSFSLETMFNVTMNLIRSFPYEDVCADFV